jgi:hypothetical protein
VATEQETTVIREEARRRWLVLEQQIARQGIDAPPEEVLEAEDLRRRWGFALSVSAPASTPAPAVVRTWTINDEISWMRTMLGSALRTATDVKQKQEADFAERPRRQLVLNLWLGAVTVIALANLYLMALLLGRFGGL